MRPVRYSEPRRATGGVGAVGALNTLGRPDMDFWALYAREALQNSWDAKAPGGGVPVGVTLAVRRMTDDQLYALRRRLLTSVPPDGRPGAWQRIWDEPTVVTVTDTGTTGMGGPVRADIVSDAAHDFVDFVWNIGQPPDKERGGGTYGYGKSVHYRASLAHTIVVYTRCMHGGRLESRLIASAWGESYVSRVEGHETPFTGRHWWGAPSGDEALPVAPLTGPHAEEVAAAIGLPRLEGAGTCVMVLAADVPSPSEWSAIIGREVSWYCWPKLVDLGQGAEMTVEVNIEGQPSPVPNPLADRDLALLVECLRDVLTHRGHEGLIRVGLQRPRKDTGWLAMRRRAGGPTTTQGRRPFDGPLRHVALMRAPRLVVRYLEGPEPPAPFRAWGGVFVADDDVDRAFAAAEPPAHDDWIPRAVDDKSDRRVVNVTLREIKHHARDFVTPVAVLGQGDHGGMAAVADELGTLLPVGGPAAAPPDPPGTPPRDSVRRSRATLTGHRITVEDGQLLLTADIDVTLRKEVRAVELALRVGVATSDGAGTERTAPPGADVPVLLDWRAPDGSTSHSPNPVVDQPRSGRWQARIRMPRDSALTLRPSCRELDDA